ncbi:MAG: hypothetical protein LBU25_03575 [Treponema sp.]|nr:hypothetical protein [Treponema sp.]
MTASIRRGTKPAKGCLTVYHSGKEAARRNLPRAKIGADELRERFPPGPETSQRRGIAKTPLNPWTRLTGET